MKAQRLKAVYRTASWVLATVPAGTTLCRMYRLDGVDVPKGTYTKHLL